jgi:tRNA uridine 5-carbamoylmethylation protein Kti12
MENKKQFVINFFSGPSAGKSTAAHQLFSYLKRHNINCEMASEYAKELVWEGSLYKLKNQISVFGEQYDRMFRLMNKVDVIITDSPLLLSAVYNKLKYPSFNNLVLEAFNDFDNYNIFFK